MRETIQRTGQAEAEVSDTVSEGIKTVNGKERKQK